MTAGEWRLPDAAAWSAGDQRLRLAYGDVHVDVDVAVRPSHVRLTVVAVDPLEKVERVQWGPLATTIRETVGETIGVVRNAQFACGIQVLNAKTLGGPSDDTEGRSQGRGRAALATPWGSTLQAYSLDRSRPRFADVWGGHFPRMPVPPIPGETVVGSAIALFGCPADEALARIGAIGKLEGLPHPEFEGVWSRANRDMGRAYLIAEYSEENIDEMLDYAVRGGFHSLYHPHPFRTWGHYELRPDHFPHGRAGMKACVDKAAARGLRLGVHTLTNFINTSDAYITPTPDPRLAKTGSSPLVGAIDAEQTEIEVADPEYFANQDANWLRTVMIDGELIRYGQVSESAPWKLLNCQRGAWGTQAAAHAAGTEVGKLLDHPYKVFFPNYDMQHEIAQRLADLFNETGLGHLDFDGHEGCLASGQGTFGEEMFALEFYNRLKRPVHVGSSQISPFFWRINTNTNWGEPWYGGFRGSMAEYRVNNQALYERNFMPHMMGWFLLTPQTTLADIEWLMARNAGYDAGFALTGSLAALRDNPRTDELLATIAAWERLRIAQAFDQTQRARLRDTDREFHLQQVADDRWMLRPYQTSPLLTHERIVRQPGEPTGSTWTFAQEGDPQPAQFALWVEGDGGAVEQIALEFDNYLTLEIPTRLETGQKLVCDGQRTVRVYDAAGRQVGVFELSMDPPKLGPGERSVLCTAEFVGEPAPVLRAQFKALGPGELVPAP
jgi:hypothetical protein